jgi:hypothetical protein
MFHFLPRRSNLKILDFIAIFILKKPNFMNFFDVCQTTYWRKYIQFLDKTMNYLTDCHIEGTNDKVDTIGGVIRFIKDTEKKEPKIKKCNK